MSRNDASLYSGLTSNSFRTVKTNPVREAKSEEKKDRQQKLTPATEIIIELLEKERKLVYDKLAKLPITIDTTEENVKSLLLSYQMNLAFIDRVENSLKNVMRKAKS